MSSCRQRSRSASILLSDDDRRTPLKRAACTPSWTSDKKRRPNKTIPSQRSSRHSSPANERGPHSVSLFVTSPSAFGLPSGSTRAARRAPQDEPLPRCSPYDYNRSETRACPKDVVHIRSKAFSELRQSVAENGHSLIHRMREYERSRSAQFRPLSRSQDSEKRGRKRIAIRRKSGHRAPSTPADDPEWRLIIGGVSEGQDRRHNSQRARSLDDMDVDDFGSDCSPLRRLSTSPSNISSSLVLPPSPFPHETSPEDDEYAMASPSSPISLYCRTQSSSPTPNSSTVSLAIHTPNGDEQNVASCPSTTDKALASLSLALANGAAGLNDYSAVLEYHTTNDTDCYDPGDLWH